MPRLVAVRREIVLDLGRSGPCRPDEFCRPWSDRIRPRASGRLIFMLIAEAPKAQAVAAALEPLLSLAFRRILAVCRRPYRITVTLESRSRRARSRRIVRSFVRSERTDPLVMLFMPKAASRPASGR